MTLTTSSLHVKLSLCGQEPETALNSALASVKFFVQQKELSAGLLQSKLEANVERVKEGCKRKLQVALVLGTQMLN